MTIKALIKQVIFDGDKGISMKKETTLMVMFDDLCQVKPSETL